MTAAPTSILLMTRGPRVHRFFVEMATELARDHRVTVLATPPELGAFAGIPGVEVHGYETLDLLSEHGVRPPRLPDPGPGEVAAIEREIGLPVYRAAGNYLLFGRIIREAGGRWNYLTTDSEIVATYAGAYQQLVRIFDRVRPDVVFFEAMDLISSYVAFALAHRRGVFSFEPRFSPLGGGRISLGFGVYRRNVVMEHLYRHRHLIAEASRKAADEIVGAAAEQLAHSSYAASHREMLHWNSPFNRRRLTAVLADPGRLVHAVSQAGRHYRVARNRRWLERHLTRTLPAAPYVMYALQHTPEAGICSQAPRWVRQEAVIEQLAISAPAGVRVVAKEHPRTFGSRGASFFSPLTDLPNVVLCHPTVSTEALLHGADGVVAVTGSPGFEALILGKRVGVLGRPFYAAYKGVRLLDHPADVYAALADRAWRPDTMVEERREFLAAYVQSLFDFGHGEGPRLYPASGGERWAAALRDVHGFVRVHGLRPADFESGL